MAAPNVVGAGELFFICLELRKYLTSPPLRKDKTVNNFDSQLKATCEATTRDIRVTLLKSGFQAWYVYLVAKPDHRDVMDSLPPFQIEALARQLGEVAPHQAVKDQFHHIFHGAFRGQARCRLLRNHGYAVPGSQGPPDPTPVGRKRRRTTLDPRPDSDTPVDTDTPVDAVIVETVAAAGTAPVEAAPSPTPQGPADVAPPTSYQHNGNLLYAKHLPSVFPPHICRSIVKTEQSADVEVETPESLEQSLLKLHIYPAKVPYLARELFDVEVDFEDDRLCLRFESGASAQIDALKLVGARPGVLDKCLGQEVATAVRQSRRYAVELTRGEASTECVSLAINGTTCFLTLVSDSVALSAIVARLWPSD